ncbi:hypothetical protein NEOLEDRAFT_373018 [Neolentinus lepideus HHB14362 ss-1]|uniref:Uncharacterized protein n=1 Tax=Neolentinus lepideus HHB14362 ss-1 TaxID=1314782 RepID=A0A165SIG4_9AGAM|nr:hypothetical protein NEOLEDRAFT_373018 [Neolentinus lepideus HHB14362 ss-1]
MLATLPGGYKPSTAHRTLSPLLFPLYLSSLPLSSALTLTLAATVLNLRWSDVEHSIRATSTSGSPLQGKCSLRTYDPKKPPLCVPLRLRGLVPCHVKKATRPRDSSQKPFQERGSGAGGQNSVADTCIMLGFLIDG